MPLILISPFSLQEGSQTVFGSKKNRKFERVFLVSVDDDRVNFHKITDLPVDTISSVLENVRKRVLRLFSRRGYLDQYDAHDMLQWENGGFSLDASVRIHAYDRAGLERLIRYCARPVFASERLSFIGNGKFRPPDLYAWHRNQY